MSKECQIPITALVEKSFQKSFATRNKDFLQFISLTVKKITPLYYAAKYANIQTAKYSDRAWSNSFKAFAAASTPFVRPGGPQLKRFRNRILGSLTLKHLFCLLTSAPA